MNYQPGLVSFRDPFYEDIWEDFEEPPFEWGFVWPWIFNRPRLRKQQRRRRGTFGGMVTPWGYSTQLLVEAENGKTDPREIHPQYVSGLYPYQNIKKYCEPRKVPGTHEIWICRRNEQPEQGCEQRSTYPESASDLPENLSITRPQWASEYFAPNQTIGISCEHQAQEKRSYPKSVSDRRESLPKSRPQWASEYFVPNQTAGVSCGHQAQEKPSYTGSASDHRLVLPQTRPQSASEYFPKAQKKRSCKVNEKEKQDKQSSTYSDDPVQSETQSVVAVKPSRAEEKSERNEVAERRTRERQRSRSCGSLHPVYSANKPNSEVDEKTSKTGNFRGSSEDKEQSKEDNEQRKYNKPKVPLVQEHEPKNDATNDEVRDPIGSRLDAIDSEVSKAKELLVRVQKFNGVKTDKEYLCLEELLLRCILSLDLIKTEGYNEVKVARRAAVKEIQSIIKTLEAKVLM